MRVSAPFAWETLGRVDALNAPVACPGEGAFRVVYWAPWCGDCRSMWPVLVEDALRFGERIAFVGAYSKPADREAFLVEHGAPRTNWSEPSERTEASRLRSFHAVLRQLSGDPRRWGVPVWYDLWIQNGRFVVRWM
jgi:thiol-disulfide isomerase/thioredoxin